VPTEPAAHTAVDIGLVEDHTVADTVQAAVVHIADPTDLVVGRKVADTGPAAAHKTADTADILDMQA
jgi:hypothetical protein